MHSGPLLSAVSLSFILKPAENIGYNVVHFAALLSQWDSIELQTSIFRKKLSHSAP